MAAHMDMAQIYAAQHPGGALVCTYIFIYLVIYIYIYIYISVLSGRRAGTAHPRTGMVGHFDFTKEKELSRFSLFVLDLPGYLAHKKNAPPPRTATGA